MDMDADGQIIYYFACWKCRNVYEWYHFDETYVEGQMFSATQWLKGNSQELQRRRENWNNMCRKCLCKLEEQFEPINCAYHQGYWLDLGPGEDGVQEGLHWSSYLKN